MRPDCVVHVPDMPGEERPRHLKAPGVASVVGGVGDATGLARMGVSVRTIAPHHTGTNRHFHEVEEEWVFVLSGEGTVRIGPLDLPVRAGSFVGFPPGPRPHCFVAGAQPLALLEGGERRREEVVWYPDARMRARHKTLEPFDGPFPPEQGDAGQVVQLEDVQVLDFQHPVEERSRRLLRSLHTETGLLRQAVRWAKVVEGDLSTSYHTHDRADEWVYVLEGRARVRVGDERFEAGPGDFLSHPAGGPAHVMEPETDLVYLMGGMIDPDDVVTYPEAGKRRIGDEIVDL